ncbi:MAG: hypothetical protein JWQ42_4754, partial [Edaphobacter sp.]|nr:hypothetical protein [Edaphobacter sp.]
REAGEIQFGQWVLYTLLISVV